MLRLPRRRERSRRRPRRARYTCWHRGHYQNQQYSVNRARQRLGAFAETHGELVGDVGHELDEQGAEERAAERGEPAHNDADEKGQRKGKPEALTRDETDGERAQAPGYARIERADGEARRLVERGVDPHRLGVDRLIANGDQRPPNPPAHEIARSPIERRGTGEANEVQPLVGGERNPGGNAGLREGQALRAAGQGVEALVAQDLRGCDGEREGRKRKIKAAEPQRGKTEQKARDEAYDAGYRDRRPVRPAELHHQDRRAIAADGEK